MTQPRSALTFNAAFSLASGLLLAIAPQSVADWLGVDTPWVLRVFGLVMIGHAALIGLFLRQFGVELTARINLLAIAPYPLLLAALIAIGWIDRPLGQVLALADAVIIAGVAVVHLIGLRNPVVGHQPQPA